MSYTTKRTKDPSMAAFGRDVGHGNRLSRFQLVTELLVLALMASFLGNAKAKWKAGWAYMYRTG